MKSVILLTGLIFPLMSFADPLCQSFAESAALAIGSINSHGKIVKPTKVNPSKSANRESFNVYLEVTADGEPDATATYVVTTSGTHECLVVDCQLKAIK